MNLHEKYRLTRIINGNGKMTKLAGAVVLPEIVEQVTEAMQWFFDIDELQARAGEVIVRATGAEAGCVTACTAAGIALSVAGTMTGNDPGKVSQLPDTRGMKNEVVLQKGHAVNFGAPITQMIRLAGAIPIEVGTVNGASEHDIRHAITENTSAIVFTISHHTTRYGSVPLKRVVEITHAHSIPVIVDGAAQSFLIREIVDTGADLVICSGHNYFGQWVNPKTRQTLCYAEGDWSLVTCADDEHYNAEILDACEFYDEGYEFIAIDISTGTRTEYRQDREKFLIKEAA